MKVGPKSSLRPFLHRALQFSALIILYTILFNKKMFSTDKYAKTKPRKWV